RFGVRPRLEPRKPMRSARVVSTVITMILGASAGAVAWNPSTARSRRRARLRIKTKGEFTIGKPPLRMCRGQLCRRSEHELESELHITLSAGAQDGVQATANVRSGEECREAAAIYVAGFVLKHGAIQNIKNGPIELHCITLSEFEILENAHV